MSHHRRASLAAGTILFISLGACSRTDYRTDADREAYEVIAERNDDPRWAIRDYSIEIDPRSRFFDPYDLDHPPMPPDDPASGRYMQIAHGIDGWPHWEKNGIRDAIENPSWRDSIADYAEVGEDGAITLDVETALKLAYLHSPFHQRQLETLYVSALDVTRERYRLDTQFFGGYDAEYTNTKDDDILATGEKGPTVEAAKLFAAGGELLVGIANSFVFDLSGGAADFSATIANFTFIQPLLRGAGKDIALEQLTRTERQLLGNLRSYSQFRQGFYTQVVIGELGVAGPQRFGPGVGVEFSRGDEGVGGYLGLVQQLQRVRNTEDNLDLQLRTLEQLEANLEAGLIDLVQVDQFRQNIERERVSLLADRNRLEQSLDGYKTGTLGLPPDLPIHLDDEPVRSFQFVAREASAIQDSIAKLQARIGGLPGDPALEAITPILDDLTALLDPARAHVDRVRADMDAMDEAVPSREHAMDEEAREAFEIERTELRERLEGVVAKLEETASAITNFAPQLSVGTRELTIRSVVVRLGELLRVVQASVLVQARARLEAISVDPVELESQEAFEIALEHRLDFMNARSALVDSWRGIQLSADALQSRLNMIASGELRTSDDSAVDFRSPDHTVRLGVEFDTPFRRLLERNAYRESLISYQQSRRAFIQSRDALHLRLRALLRDIEELRSSLEIQRRAVAIAIRRVDLTRAELYAPVRPPQPGQRPAQFGPTAAINLLSALSSLRDTQNNFLSVWLSYYAARVRLYRELGIMQLDGEGRWIETEIPPARPTGGAGARVRLAAELPPPIPSAWLDETDGRSTNTGPTRRARE